MRSFLVLMPAIMATACNSTQAPAEQVQPNTATTGSYAPSGQSGSMGTTRVTSENYVTRAAMANMYEVQAGRLATNNGNSNEVREIGRMMMDDHTTSVRDLQSAVGQSNMTTAMPSSLDAEHQAKLDRLTRARGEAFDREYMSQQMPAHRRSLALHQNYAANGEDANLKAFAQKSVPVVQKHMSRLERLSVGDMGGMHNPSQMNKSPLMNKPSEMNTREQGADPNQPAS